VTRPEPDTGKARPANKRGAARLAAVQALYQMDVGQVSLEATLAQFSAGRMSGEFGDEEFLPADPDYLRQIVRGVVKDQLNIDPVIDNALTDNWPVGRIDATLRAILRAAVFELLRKPDVPAGVVISEYVDVAKAFFEGEVPAMVHAVLDTIAGSGARAKPDQTE
jgi:N utilization substance protein B